MTRAEAEALAARLVEEMIRRWRQGERALPEEFLARHPELWEHPEAAADLIYEEICLRQEHGPEVAIADVLGRFPQWRPQLEVLLDCQHLLGPCPAVPRFPAAGDFLGDFLLLAELGRGARGRVFLAGQLSLGDRPVVLKVTPAADREHLALARLQHTHIVPLHSVQDHPERGLRSLCMPYFGGVTLGRLFDALRPCPPARRTGRQLLDALDRLQAVAPVSVPAAGPARQALAETSYVQAICWIGACLADALQYAHERGLVHLDLKPSNVLLAADAQPMLLDFHLARAPIPPGTAGLPELGGTVGYMAPEQQEAVRAVQESREVAQPVDARADIFALGVVLYEALGGSRPEPGAPSLHRRNAEVSVGLSDVIGRCLAPDSDRRYPRMAALAADLRRHLAHRPLAGVRNRSLAERWRKWRRRRPHGAALAGMMLAVLLAAAAVGLGAVNHFAGRLRWGRTALNEAQAQLDRADWDGAIRTLERGRDAVRGVPFQDELAGEFARRLGRAEAGRDAAARAAVARDLHRLADQFRFLYGADPLPCRDLCGLEAHCRALWEQRGRIVTCLSAGGNALEPAARAALLDLAICRADLLVRRAPAPDKAAARREARAVLDQAEALFGPSPVLDEERRLHGQPVRPACRSGHVPRTAWEHYALGRSLLRSGDLHRSAEELRQAVRLEPQGLWPNFYTGLCAYRLGRYEDAATAFSVCIGAAPEAATCFYNRALAFAALGRAGPARADFDQARRLDPCLMAAPADLVQAPLSCR
jgi:tetratricopeptide (TPR) repeat protein